MRDSGEALVKELAITDGLEVLDLGCGDGTTALPAARLGANVLGVDIATNLVEAGNARAQSLGLNNCTVPRRRRDGPARARGRPLRPRDQHLRSDVRAEAVRRRQGGRPGDAAGGRIVMGNWIPNDPTLVAQLLQISAAYSPPPPEGFISPMTWGVEHNVIERFASAGVPEEKISFEREHLHVQLSRHADRAARRVQDLLRPHDERVRCRRRQRPRERAAGRAGIPVRPPQHEHEHAIPPPFPQPSCSPLSRSELLE